MFYRSLTEDPTVRMRRARVMVALAGVAFAIGLIVGANHSSSPAHGLAARFVSAWAKRDYKGMYLLIDGPSQRAVSASHFAFEYENALRTATATRLRVTGKPSDVSGGLVRVPVRVDTRLFGALAVSFRVRVLRGGASGGEGDAIAWSPSLQFPGLHAGEVLSRHTSMPPRAPLLARDGSVLAEGAAASAGQRNSPLGNVASAVVGTLGAVPSARRGELEEQGISPQAIVGVSGLEAALDARLRGAPGGQLLASGSGSVGTRVLASAPPRPAPPVRTSVSPAVQRAAVTALGGQLGGIVALKPSTGEILAVAGIGLDSLQPPGSTFKMVTVSAVLDASIASAHTAFPYATYATLDGVKLNNANGESCGGTLEQAFATSCNSVFAPLGAKLGAQRLVAMAERFGFNGDPGMPGAAQSTLPAPSSIQGELATGSTAIGQGQVQASALQMAIVAATIADGGSRPRPSFTPAAQTPGTHVLSADVARTVRRFMTDVVRNGTGTAAAIPGVVVAGKTGTAELKSQCSSAGSESSHGAENAAGESSAREAGAEGCQGTATEPSNTDAWFAAFAPASHPRIDVGVLLVKAGAGGETAAPVARQVLEAGLRRGA
jgi:hypothetical protein